MHSITQDASHLTLKNKTYDLTGKWLLPPIVDLCGRLREPGRGAHGTLASEGRAARKNGILHVMTPPDTDPVLQRGSLLEGLRQKAWDDGGIHLHICGALTEDLAGMRPANVFGLAQGKVVGLSNARAPFLSDDVMLRALEYAATFGLGVFFYPDEPSLSKNGLAHDGYVASFHGLTGIPWLAETVALAKQILIAEETGVRAHFSQLSCRTSLDLIRFAKDRGLPVTCDVAMHQLFLTDDDLIGYNTNAFVYPPLRSRTDQKALREGLKDGTIDAICSHHEPLSSSAKEAPFAEAKAGISAFDTFIPLAVRLVQEGVLTLDALVDKICHNPAKILKIDQDPSLQGAVLVDPKARYVLDKGRIHSKGKNTPFLGREMVGCVLETSF